MPHWIEDLPSPLLEEMATTMQETYPALAFVILLVGNETAPVPPTEFFGWICPMSREVLAEGDPIS